MFLKLQRLRAAVEVGTEVTLNIRVRKLLFRYYFAMCV